MNYALTTAVLAVVTPLSLAQDFSVPAFNCFGPSPTMRFDMTAAESDLSGIAWNPITSTLFAVNNGDRIVYEIDFPNTLVQSWNVSAVTLDLEGIAVVDPAARMFAITDENPASVMTLTLHANGTYSNVETLVQGLPEPAGSNLGFEGVAYWNDQQKYVMVQEGSPSRIWEWQDGTLSNLTGDLINHPVYSIRAIGGMTKGGGSDDEAFVIAKTYTGLGRDNETYYQKAILRYNLTSGTFTERFGGEVCNMGQPEGITFYKNGTKIVMLVVGETYEALVYEADETCGDALGSLSMEMATCEKQVQSIAACEKTRDDGGCGWLRCDKDLTEHTKICTDDEPGVTDCTETECFEHCQTNNFAAATVKKVTDAGPTCTHWAYDVKEKECYIFAGCNNEKFDEDYTLYAMQDITCERTLEDYPLGCEQRRCDKDQSTHNKICTDDQPGVTDCSLEECQAKCQSHTEFSCTTYAYDVKEKECYLFQSCENEGFDEDYSTYVLIDPTCDKNETAGGCNQRRCDKDVTPHDKICVDDTPEQQCSMDECKRHCAEKVFEDVGAEAFCTHWAYDAVDKECYLFHGCIAEKYDDDYVLFTQSYGERMNILAGEGDAEPSGATVRALGMIATVAAMAFAIFVV